MQTTPRSFSIQAVLIVITVGLGLASRRFSIFLPEYVASYSGDTLWATVVFLGFRVFLPRCPSWKVAGLAFVFSVAIELSQLYHAPCIDSVRSTKLGGLVLGFGFRWSDLACYAVGVVIGSLVDFITRDSSATIH